MGKRTSIYLTDALNARIERSGMTPLRLIEYALDHLGRPSPTPPDAASRAPRPRTATTPARRPAESTAPAAPRSSASSAPKGIPAPAQVIYSRVRSALGERAGETFTASDVAESLGITHHLAVGRLRYLGQLGMAECLGRTAGQGNPYAYRLTQVGQRRLCTEAQCDHAHHRNDQIPA